MMVQNKVAIRTKSNSPQPPSVLPYILKNKNKKEESKHA